jgi:hypothetical protein
VVSDNVFRNVNRISDYFWVVPEPKIDFRNNIAECDPAVTGGFSTSNKGIGYIHMAGGRVIYRIMDSDPNSATYGDLKNNCPVEANAMPTTGTYVRGHFVKNNSYNIDGSGMVLLGWARLTTSVDHASGTDWALCYASHVPRVLFTSSAYKLNSGMGTGEVSMIGTGVGTTIIPANTLKPGTTIRIRARGYNNTGNPAGFLVHRIKFNSTVIVTHPQITLTPGLSNRAWFLDVDISFTSGNTVRAYGMVTRSQSNDGTSPKFWVLNSPTAITINPAIAQTIDFTTQWTIPTNNITCTSLTIEVLN